MVGAVLAGDGLERVAEIASAHAGAPVAVVVPRLGVPLEGWARYERYVGARLAGGRPQRPSDVTAEVPISSGGRELGAVLLLGPGRPDAGEYLHMAAIAALTEVAVVEAKDETEQTLRGSFLEELLTRPDLDPADVQRRAARLGCDLAGGFVALCANPNGRGPGRLVAALAAELPGALAQAVEDKVYALLPGPPDPARRAAARLGRHAEIGLSSYRSGAARGAPGARGGRAGAGRHGGRRRTARRRDRRGHLPPAVPRAGQPPAGGAQLLRGHGGAAGALRRAVRDRPGRHASTPTWPTTAT